MHRSCKGTNEEIPGIVSRVRSNYVNSIMRLHEIADDFEDPEILPPRQHEIAIAREPGLRHNQEVITAMQDALTDKLEAYKQTAGWPNNDEWPALVTGKDKDDEKINEIRAKGYFLLLRGSKYPMRIIAYYKITPENETLIKKLESINRKLISATAAIEDNTDEIRKSKNRISAWKRKQPTYVGRATGKELLEEIKQKVNDFIGQNNWICSITNSYYWAKNKMIVIDISVRNSAPGMTVNGFAKTIKVAMDKFMTDQGYSKFRVTDRVIDGQLTLVKIQLDDVEAKNKA